MIIACPACATRYVVPDSAIGVDGRTVRCAKCRHSWFQEGPLELTNVAPAPVAAPSVPIQEPVPEPTPQAGSVAEPSREPMADTRPGFAERILPSQPDEAPDEVQPVREPEPEAAPEEEYQEEADERFEPPESFTTEPAQPVAEETYADEVEDEYSQFDHEPPFRRRRNLLRLWTIAASVFALFALGTVFAVSYWGLPDWVPISKPTFGLGQEDLVLDFPQDKQDRRELPNGTEFFGASGSVTNVGRETRSLPPILIVLRDARDRIVYEWEIAPPKRTLAPGETLSINEAVTDVPKAARIAEFGWKPQ